MQGGSVGKHKTQGIQKSNKAQISKDKTQKRMRNHEKRKTGNFKFVRV